MKTVVAYGLGMALKMYHNSDDLLLESLKAKGLVVLLKKCDD